MTDAASDNVSATAATRDARGRFQPGRSGNPAGKKPGTLNRATILKRVMAEGDDEQIAKLILERARKGEWGPMRFVLERLEPKPRARPIALDFPEDASIGELHEIVLRAMADGEISPDEALQITRLLDKVETHRNHAEVRGALQRAKAARAGTPQPLDPRQAAVMAHEVLHSPSIDRSAASPAAAAFERRRRRAATAAATQESLPDLAALAADAIGRADGLHPACNLQP